MLYFDPSALNWADILISGVAGLILVMTVDYFRILLKRRRLKKFKGVYIASDKDDPSHIKSIIELTLKNGNNLTFNLKGESLRNSTYSGDIEMNSSNLKTGKGTYAHHPIKIDTGDYIGFGTVDVSIHTKDCLLVVQTYQSGYGIFVNPELWKRVEGEDIGKSILELKEKYAKDIDPNEPERISYLT